MNLSKKLKQLREQRSMTQEELARRAGVRQPYIARIEIGDVKDPRVSTRKKLAKALGVPITELLD